jgi:hypothetical protein
MAFANAADGWLEVAASVEGNVATTLELLATTDAGADWRRQWAGPANTPLDLFDPGRRDAWLSLARSLASGPYA